MPSDAVIKRLAKFDLIQKQGTLVDPPCDTCARKGKVCKILPSASKKCGACFKQNSWGCTKMGWTPPPPRPAQEEKEDDDQDTVMTEAGDDDASDRSTPPFRVIIHQPASPTEPANAVPPAAQNLEKKKLPLLYSNSHNKEHVHLTKAEGYRLPMLPRENLYNDFEVDDNDLKLEKAVGLRPDVRNVTWLKAGWYAVFGVSIDGQAMDAALILPRYGDVNMEEEIPNAHEGSRRIAHLKADKYAIVAIHVGGFMKSGAIILPLDENPVYDVDEKTFQKLLPKGASSYSGGLDADQEEFERNEREGPKGRKTKVHRTASQQRVFVHSLQPKTGKADYDQNGFRVR